MVRVKLHGRERADARGHADRGTDPDRHRTGIGYQTGIDDGEI